MDTRKRRIKKRKCQRQAYAQIGGKQNTQVSGDIVNNYAPSEAYIKGFSTRVNEVRGNDIEGDNNAIHITHNYSPCEGYMKDFSSIINTLVSENMKLNRKISTLERKLKAAEKQLVQDYGSLGH